MDIFAISALTILTLGAAVFLFALLYKRLAGTRPPARDQVPLSCVMDVVERMGRMHSGLLEQMKDLVQQMDRMHSGLLEQMKDLVQQMDRMHFGLLEQMKDLVEQRVTVLKSARVSRPALHGSWRAASAALYKPSANQPIKLN